ncbi:MAG: hypothetical protein KDB26_02225 [Microthrixaceae bacterium]|nr:hypothetical protein [Microthrixaceae bacterium]
MADQHNDQAGGNTLLKLLIVAIIGMIIAGAGRKVALTKADKEFEERLRRADERRD